MSLQVLPLTFPGGSLGIHSHCSTTPEGVALSLGLLSVECEQKNRIIAPLILLILKRLVKWFELRVALSRLEKP